MGQYARVVVDVPTAGQDQVFDYQLPAGLGRPASVGDRVLVPFGPRHVQGFIVAFSPAPAVESLKYVEALLDPVPLLTEAHVRLAQFVHAYYLAPLSDVLWAMVPAGLRGAPRHVLSLARPDPAVAPELLHRPHVAEVLEYLSRHGAVEREDLEAELGPCTDALRVLRKAGIIRVDAVYHPRVGPATERILVPVLERVGLEAAAEALLATAPRQAAALQAFCLYWGEPMGMAELARRAGVSVTTVRALCDRGYLRLESRQRYRASDDLPVASSKEPVLTTEQEAAVRAITAASAEGGRGEFLLYGVTGSGKTEVYLRAIRSVVQSGRQAIVLVPEISLTPQLAQIFRSRFGDRVAVWHSAMGAGQRYDLWQRTRMGGIDVIIGARSAVFAPVPKLGLVVIDEEHENTYKQTDQDPRYHTRTVALARARQAGASVILGSATPSFDSYYAALRGELTLLRLSQRVEGRPMPPAVIVDMRQELERGNRSLFSVQLQERLQASLDRGEQALLFLNRRGYAGFLLCRSCGHVVRCPHCDVSLSLHAGGRILQCHYCGYTRPVPDSCPVCHSPHIRQFGTGTERVEAEVRRLLPKARVVRMDRDTTARRGAHARILLAMQNHSADVLVGTQMIAKGFDLPEVTTVGVVAADITLFHPDFRAAERTFQLLTQVAGRAGRGLLPGQVIIQTYNPEHPAIKAASHYDYEGFYAKEMETRRMLGYPPFGVLVVMTATAEKEPAAREVGEVYAAAAAQVLVGRGEVLGPAVPVPGRLRGRYRWQVTLKGTEREVLLEAAASARHAVGRVARRHGATVAIDVDPQTTGF